MSTSSATNQNNQSMTKATNKSFDKNSLNGGNSQSNTFYGSMSVLKSGSINHPQSRQINNGLGSKGGTLTSQ